MLRSARHRLPGAVLVARERRGRLGTRTTRRRGGARTVFAVALTAVQKVGGLSLDLHDPLLGRPGRVDDDDVHPNAAGHRALADAVEAALDAAGL